MIHRYLRNCFSLLGYYSRWMRLSGEVHRDRTHIRKECSIFLQRLSGTQETNPEWYKSPSRLGVVSQAK